MKKTSYAHSTAKSLWATPVGGKSYLRSQPMFCVPPRVEPVNSGAGSLYIRDYFTPSPFPAATGTSIPHGMLVMGAAELQAGSGARMNPSVHDDPEPLINRDPSYAALNSQKMPEDQVRSALVRDVEIRGTTFLNDQADYLERVTQTGVKNSAANFSLGTSKASESGRVYGNVLEALRGGNQVLADNYCRAFGVNADRLRSRDESVSQGEHAKLQRAVVSHTCEAWDGSEKLGASIRRWDAAVENFERNNNSVVISSGNEGRVEEAMEEMAGGRELRVPADFEKNILENDIVTTVGATDETGRVADYSSETGGVDIYARGRLPDLPGSEPIEGTSFASSRVGVVMAELHRLHPSMSSAQVEELMRRKLSQPLAQGNGSAPVLREDADLEFLRSRTF